MSARVFLAATAAAVAALAGGAAGHAGGDAGSPGPAEQRRAVERLVRLGYPVRCGGGRGNAIALTFDDGPGAYTSLMLLILKRRGMRGTFFLNGKSIDAYPELPRREAARNALGNHSWSHSYLPALPRSRIDEELRSTSEAIRKTAGVRVRLFRPPYGARNSDVDQASRAQGMATILWSVDSRDSIDADVEGVWENVRAGLRPGAIVLLHENRATTIKSLLRYVLPEIRRRGLKTVTVPELMALDPPTVAQLKSGTCP